MPRLEGRDIVCFANDWSGDPLSKKHVMRRLAERNRILWVNSLGNRAPRATSHDLGRIAAKLKSSLRGIEAVERNISVLSPLAIPSYASRAIRRLNGRLVGLQVRRAMAQLGFRRPLLYTFVPASAWVIDELDGWATVYHCVDEYSAFDGAGAPIASLEADLIRHCDLVITCSQPLQERKSLLHTNTVLIRHGVEYNHFAQAVADATLIPDEVERLPGPILGFGGLVAEWVDLNWLVAAADAFPDGSLVIVGACNNADAEGLRRLQSRPNVHLLGRRPYEALPGYYKAFDVALLPFVQTELTRAANPLKLREYLAAGLPVVATDIPEARALESAGVYLATDGQSFVSQIRKALADALPRRLRSSAMAEESWDAKVVEIENTILRLA